MKQDGPTFHGDAMKQSYNSRMEWASAGSDSTDDKLFFRNTTNATVQSVKAF